VAEPGKQHEPRPAHLYFGGGVVPPHFCLSIVSLCNTISIGSTDKVNRLLEKNFAEFWQYFLNNISNIICNLAGFRHCLAEYTVHSLSSCYGLLTPLVLLNSIAGWYNTGMGILVAITDRINCGLLLAGRK